MNWLTPSIIITFISSIIMCFTFYYLYIIEKKKYLAVWAISWGLYSIRFVFEIVANVWGKNDLIFILNQLSSLWSGALLLWGSYIFSNKDVNKGWLLTFILGTLWIIISVVSNFSFTSVTTPTFFIMAIANIMTGIAVLKFQEIKGVAKSIAGWSFILWGFHKINYPFIRPMEWLAPWGYLLGAVLAFLSSLAIIMVYFQRVKKELQNSEERYRLLVETANEGIWIIDGNQVTTYVNKAMANMLGYKPSEMIGKKIVDFIFPEDMPYHIEKMKMREEGKDDIYERRLKKKEGNEIWAIVSAKALKDERGNFIGSFAMYTDITQLKEKERELTASEDKFRKIFNLSPVIILISELEDGTILDVNEYFLRALDLKREEVIGRTSTQLGLIDPVDRNKLIKKLKEKGSVIGIEHRFYSIDKKEITSLYSGIIINIDGQQRLLSIIQDITEIKNFQENLLKSEARFRSYFEMPLHGIAITTTDKKWLEFNDHICSILGYDRKELISMTWVEITYPDDLVADLEQYEKILSGKLNQYVMEKRFIRKDGTIIWTNVSVGCVRREDGIVDYIVFVIDDITDRKYHERLLEESEERYRTIFNNVPLGIMHFDSLSIIRDFNENFARIMGAPREKILGFNMLERLKDQAMLKAVQDSLEGRLGYYEGDYLSVTGNKLTPLRAIFQTIRGKDGEFLGAVGIFEDITERRKAEETIKASLKEKEVLLREIQHRVKNNLLTISGILSLQLNQLKDSESRRALITCMNRVNAISRIHSKLYESQNYSFINIKEYLHELIWELSRSHSFPFENITMNMKDIVMEINIAIPLGLILNELVTNVMKHAFPGKERGEIEITISKEEDSKIKLFVSDNGIGIPPHIDIENSDSVGFMLINQLVQQIDGHMSLIREKGTKVVMTFPLH